MKEFEYMSERRAATRAGVARNTLRRARAAGRIKATVIENVILYSRAALDTWADEFRKERGRR